MMKFMSIEQLEWRIRYYGSTAIVTGKTRMSGAFEGAPFSVNSSYTHVYVIVDGDWKLASAQGTPTA
jgi:ketosteroid isomerase-like protein